MNWIFFYEYFNAELTKPKIIIILTFNSYETIKWKKPKIPQRAGCQRQIMPQKYVSLQMPLTILWY